MISIESYEPVLKNLVMKYNNGIWDEDLMQDAWVAAISCYNHNKDKELSDDILQAKIITWVRNKLIDIKRKKQVETTPLDMDIEWLDDTLLLVELRQSLSERENTVLTYLLEGYNVHEICDMMNLSKTEIYRIQNSIKGKIRS